MTTRRTTVLVTLLLILMSAVAFAGKGKGTKTAKAKLGPGTTAVKTANDKISDLLAKKAPAADVTKAVRDFIDIDELGQRAMDAHWASMSDAQKKQFLHLLHDLIEDSYSKGLKANLNYKVNYVSETKQPNGDLVVKTEIKTQRHGHPYTVHVDYTLEQKDKVWKAYDVATEGQGLVDNYKGEFDKIISKGSVDDLIAKMQKKHDDNAKDAAGTGTGTGTGSGSAATN